MRMAPGSRLFCVRKHSRLSSYAFPERGLQMSRTPAAMNDAIRSFIAPKSSALHLPPESLSVRPVRASVSISAPVTKW